MKKKCSRCGQPATAGPDPRHPQREQCIECASLAKVNIPVNLERLAGAPRSVVSGPAWILARGVSREESLWLHQANALNELEGGNNVVVATSTASGKTLIFQLWTMHRLETEGEKTTALVFYPTKALANDQARRWQECCRTIGLEQHTVGQIDGDVQPTQRDAVVQQSRIILATPDVCHAWMLRRVDDPIIGDFLRRLRVIIIDQAHTYESVFGSNSAYLFRRLTAAALHTGAPEPPRFIAATATIQAPGQHLEKLTGADFTVIEEAQNGSPRHPRHLYHLPTDARGGATEAQLAHLVTSIIDNDPEAQVIAFHDSRMGVERIVQRIHRPEEVLPYRSGYLAQDRRNIEARLRDNSIRGVIATSALELGIDMPDLNYGVNLDLPPSRKQFHQRLGRVGRSKPGNFIILARATRFSAYGETLVHSQLSVRNYLIDRPIRLSWLVGSVDDGGGSDGPGQVRSAAGARTTEGTPAFDSGREKPGPSDRPSPDSTQERRWMGGSPGGGRPGCGAGHRVPDQAALYRGGVGEGPVGPAPGQPASEVGRLGRGAPSRLGLQPSAGGP